MIHSSLHGRGLPQRLAASSAQGIRHVASGGGLVTSPGRQDRGIPSPRDDIYSSFEEELFTNSQMSRAILSLEANLSFGRNMITQQQLEQAEFDDGKINIILEKAYGEDTVSHSIDEKLISEPCSITNMPSFYTISRSFTECDIFDVPTSDLAGNTESLDSSEPLLGSRNISRSAPIPIPSQSTYLWRYSN